MEGEVDKQQLRIYGGRSVGLWHHVGRFAYVFARTADRVRDRVDIGNGRRPGSIALRTHAQCNLCAAAIGFIDKRRMVIHNVRP